MTAENKRIKKSKKEGKVSLAFSETITILSSFLLLGLLLKNPDIVQSSVAYALKQCATFLIPSLFPLMTVSEIVTECGAIDYITRRLNAPLSKLFGISKNAVSPFFLGLVGGYTTSVNSALSIYKQGNMSKADCESIINYSSLPSIGFLTGFVGKGALQDSTTGWILWFICIFSTIIIAIVDRLLKKAFKKTNFDNKLFFENANSDINPIGKINKKSFSKIFVGAIAHSAQAMLIICSCVVFFSTLTSTLRYPLNTLELHENTQLLLLGSLELMNGISACINVSSPEVQAALCSFFVGWSGLCVHFQIIALCEDCDLSFKKYFIFKALQGALCALISFVIF